MKPLLCCWRALARELRHTHFEPGNHWIAQYGVLQGMEHKANTMLIPDALFVNDPGKDNCNYCLLNINVRPGEYHQGQSDLPEYDC